MNVVYVVYVKVQDKKVTELCFCFVTFSTFSVTILLLDNQCQCFVLFEYSPIKIVVPTF